MNSRCKKSPLAMYILGILAVVALFTALRSGPLPEGEEGPPLEEPPVEENPAQPAPEPSEETEEPEAAEEAAAGVLISGKGIEIDVSISGQVVRVFKDGLLLKEMTASTGEPDKPTPTGRFKIENRGEWFWSEKYRQGGLYWVSFLNRGEYLFHSVPTDQDRNIIPEEAEKLGKPASHGCVRLSVEDARWLYESVPENADVYIHD